MIMTTEAHEKPEGSYRILHTADWHLGKRLNDQERDEEHKLFLAWLLDVVREQAVDAIILAGDVFDTANPPQPAVKQYYDFVSDLSRHEKCAFVVIAGNHDSPAQLEAPKQLLQVLGAQVVGNLAEDASARIICLPDEEKPAVAVALVPFLRDRDLRIGKAGEGPDEIASKMVAGIKKRYEETAAAASESGLACPLVATGHLTVVGGSSSDSELDIHIGGLGAVEPSCFSGGFSYVALGHLHRPQAAGGDERVRYSGSPIALSFSEADDRKEVRILDVTEERIAHHSLSIPVYRRLAQIRTTIKELEGDIEAFDPATGELPTWVEVIVEDATLEDDLNERVRSLAKHRSFEVLKVLRGSPATISGMDLGGATDDEAIESLLDDPARVFEHVLSQHEKLNEKDQQKLKAAFTQVVEQEAQSEQA